MLDEQDCVEIPYQQLSTEALQAVIEEFICREGTDYGEIEHSLQDKIDQLRHQLQQGRAKIVFDPVSESCNFLPVEGVS